MLNEDQSIMTLSFPPFWVMVIREPFVVTMSFGLNNCGNVPAGGTKGSTVLPISPGNNPAAVESVGENAEVITSTRAHTLRKNGWDVVCLWVYLFFIVVSS
jgi:hypothetical protein